MKEEEEDYQTRRILLQCCSRLGMSSLSDISECRTIDVASALETRLRTIDDEADEKSPVHEAQATAGSRIDEIRSRVASYCEAYGRRPETLEGRIFRYVTDKWGPKSGADIALKLAEECGEVAGAVVRMDEERGDVDGIADELGDLLIVASQLAFLLGGTLDEIRAERWRVIQERNK